MKYIVTWFLVKWVIGTCPYKPVYDKFGRDVFAPNLLTTRTCARQDTLFLSQAFDTKSEAQGFIKEGSAITNDTEKRREKGELDLWLSDKGIMINFKLDSVKMK